MKSGGPWNLRGLRPEAREAAREAARESGMSVGEWLNSVIRPEDDEDDEPAVYRDFDDSFDDDRPRYRQRHGREESRRDPDWRHRERPHHRSRERDRDFEREREMTRNRNRDYERDREREIARVREQERERERQKAWEREREREIELEKQRQRELAREQMRQREKERERARERNLERATAQTHEELGELHGRLDKLSSQIEHLARRNEAQRQAIVGERPAANGDTRAPRLTGAPVAPRRLERSVAAAPAKAGQERTKEELTIDQAVAEITARQRALDGEAPDEIPHAEAARSVPPRKESWRAEAAPSAPPPKATWHAEPAPSAPQPEGPWHAEPPQFSTPVPREIPRTEPIQFPTPAPETSHAESAQSPQPAPEEPPQAERVQNPAHTPFATVDLSGLKDQLRHITALIEELHPANDLGATISAIRADLADLARLVTDAQPRRAVESLEIEIRALAQRIDHSRQCGVDASAIAGIERNLAEMRDVLRGLTTSESLVGFEDAVSNLTKRLDQIGDREDPAALQQLETAIGALRGIVSHVASNDTLTKVAEDVRSLAAKVDEIASTATNATTMSMLESRIDTLTSALTASTEAGQAVPRELEKLLSGLIEKLEWAELTHTDQAALGHLEDRIAALVKRLDASDARFANLEAVERGIADLLVHFEQMRSGDGRLPTDAPAATNIIERDVAAIKQSERRTLDSLEAVHGTVEQVVDRLAMIEAATRPTATQEPFETAEQPLATTAPGAARLQHESELESEPLPPPVVASPPPAAAASKPALAAGQRPIDPNLPPDHPLEPGSTPARSRSSAADRIAASEAAANAVKPPVIPDPTGKSNFIAAARRAAQAAAATPYDPKPAIEAAAADDADSAAPKPVTQRLRKLLVAGAAVLIVIGCLHIATRMFEDNSATSDATHEKTSPPAAALPETNPPVPPAKEPLSLVSPGAAPATAPSIPPSPPAGGGDIGAAPGRQSRAYDRAAPATALPSWISPDVTGSVPSRTPQGNVGLGTMATPSAVGNNLPDAIGGPALRSAAAAGDAAAAYEVAMRFAEGRGVRQSYEDAARWLDRAAKQGLAPAQFRLGTFYEKGIAVKKDLAAARDLYNAAAEKGNGKAMHNLAVLYAEGINGPPDYRSAAHWFRQAADHGISDSQYNLGILYARGIGVEQNFVESYKWFALASNQGDKEAAKKRDEIAAKLDQQSMTAAKLAAQTWSAQAQPDEAINVKTPPGGWDQPAAAAQPPKAKPRATSASAATPGTRIN